MKKILLILSETHLPQQVSRIALDIAESSKSLLEVVFIDDINALNYAYPFPNDLYLAEKSSAASTTVESSQLILDMAKIFRDLCNGSVVEYSIKTDEAVSLKYLIRLSEFCDLIITGSGTESDEYSLKEMLADAHCPLLIVPKLAVTAEKLFLVYDGSAASMHAIKMFSYIFPDHTDLPAQFLLASASELDDSFVTNEINTWASKHFSNLLSLPGPGNTWNTMLEAIRRDSKKAIVVMSAFSGSAIAGLFIKNMADSIIQETNATLFITHK